MSFLYRLYYTPRHVVSQFKDCPGWQQLQCEMREMVSYSWKRSFDLLQESRSLQYLLLLHFATTIQFNTTYLTNLLQHLHQQFLDSTDFL